MESKEKLDKAEFTHNPCLPNPSSLLTPLQFISTKSFSSKSSPKILKGQTFIILLRTTVDIEIMSFSQAHSEGLLTMFHLNLKRSSNLVKLNWLPSKKQSFCLKLESRTLLIWRKNTHANLSWIRKKRRLKSYAKFPISTNSLKKSTEELKISSSTEFRSIVEATKTFWKTRQNSIKSRQNIFWRFCKLKNIQRL